MMYKDLRGIGRETEFVFISQRTMEFEDTLNLSTASLNPEICCYGFGLLDGKGNL